MYRFLRARVRVFIPSAQFFRLRATTKLIAFLLALYSREGGGWPDGQLPLFLTVCVIVLSIFYLASCESEREVTFPSTGEFFERSVYRGSTACDVERRRIVGQLQEGSGSSRYGAGVIGFVYGRKRKICN